MLLEKSSISNTDRQEEILPMKTESFPYLCNRTTLDCSPDKSIPWHWHNLFEINYVIQGELSLRTPDASHIIRAGEADFLNIGVLHSCTALGSVPCAYYTIHFDMHFLSGMYNSVFEEKYFLPVRRNNALQLWPIRPDSLEHVKMAEAILQAVEITKKESFGYEFELRNILSSFWLRLLEDTKDVHPTAAPQSSADTERLKIMTSFIKEHCGERLSLDDIAASAGISTRECTRCFSRCIDTSPNVYLTQTRLSMAADLLADSAKSIIEISEDCGFSSPSYFGKVFREAMGCTPKEYREKGGAGNSSWYYSTQFGRITRQSGTEEKEKQ